MANSIADEAGKEQTVSALSGKPGLNLAQQLVEQLMGEIRSGKLLPGMKMPSESSLVSRFGVSRTVVREAISRLQAAGLVESQQGKGSFVLMAPAEPGHGMDLSTVNTVADVVELIGFRLGVEVEAAGLAALQRSDAEAEGLLRAVAKLRLAPAQTSQAVEADFDFHLRVARATGNRFYAELLESLGPGMIAFPGHRLPSSTEAGAARVDEVICREHEAIAEAISDADPDSARAAMRLHLANSRNRIARRK
jgi:GntR family transcriptional repressor for pyruvate dehydrogenase complex